MSKDVHILKFPILLNLKWKKEGDASLRMITGVNQKSTPTEGPCMTRA